jgi:hypothetical protein
MLRSHKIRLVPNQAQEVYFAWRTGAGRVSAGQSTTGM